LTASATASSTPIPTSPASSYPAATPPRLTVGHKAHITPGTPNSLRESPTHTSKLLGSLPGGAEIQVLASPVCDGQLVWWQVSYQGHTGWTPESDGKTYFIVPEWTVDSLIWYWIEVSGASDSKNAGTTIHLAEEVYSARSPQYGKKPTGKPFLHPASLEAMSSASMSQAVRRLLAQLYRGLIEKESPVSDMTPEKDERNRAIYHRYLAGERAVDLAREFGISVRRVDRLIRRYLTISTAGKCRLDQPQWRAGGDI
jgi:hypothetical protein